MLESLKEWWDSKTKTGYNATGEDLNKPLVAAIAKEEGELPGDHEEGRRAKTVKETMHDQKGI